jgi:hypothetical protein
MTNIEKSIMKNREKLNERFGFTEDNPSDSVSSTNEKFLINELLTMYTHGYTNDDLDCFIDNHFATDEADLPTHINGDKIVNLVLKSIVELSFCMYDSKEMDILLAQLFKTA